MCSFDIKSSLSAQRKFPSEPPRFWVVGGTGFPGDGSVDSIGSRACARYSSHSSFSVNKYLSHAISFIKKSLSEFASLSKMTNIYRLCFSSFFRGDFQFIHEKTACSGGLFEGCVSCSTYLASYILCEIHHKICIRSVAVLWLTLQEHSIHLLHIVTNELSIS